MLDDELMAGYAILTPLMGAGAHSAEYTGTVLLLGPILEGSQRSVIDGPKFHSPKAKNETSDEQIDPAIGHTFPNGGNGGDEA
jgi:hypothetical protein